MTSAYNGPRFTWGAGQGGESHLPLKRIRIDNMKMAHAEGLLNFQ